MERQLDISTLIPIECFNTLCAAVIAQFVNKYNSKTIYSKRSWEYIFNTKFCDWVLRKGNRLLWEMR